MTFVREDERKIMWNEVRRQKKHAFFLQIKGEVPRKPHNILIEVTVNSQQFCCCCSNGAEIRHADVSAVWLTYARDDYIYCSLIQVEWDGVTVIIVNWFVCSIIVCETMSDVISMMRLRRYISISNMCSNSTHMNQWMNYIFAAPNS